MLTKTASHTSTRYIALALWHNTPIKTLLNNTRLPATVFHKAAAFSSDRQHQYLASRALLAELLYYVTGITQLPETYTDHNSRPHFTDPHLPDFNISHSGGKVAVALSTTGKIGLDLEISRENNALFKIAAKRFSEEEYRWLTTLPAEKQLAGFWQLWTIKEAILKLYSKGVWQMKEVEISPHSLTVKKAFTDLPKLFLSQTTNYHLALSYLSQTTQIALLHFPQIEKNSTYSIHYFPVEST